MFPNSMFQSKPSFPSMLQVEPPVSSSILEMVLPTQSPSMKVMLFPTLSSVQILPDVLVLNGWAKSYWNNTVATQRFRCPELLFKPYFMTKDDPGIHELTYKSIMKSDMDLRKDLYLIFLLISIFQLCQHRYVWRYHHVPRNPRETQQRSRCPRPRIHED